MSAIDKITVEFDNLFFRGDRVQRHKKGHQSDELI